MVTCHVTYPARFFKIVNPSSWYPKCDVFGQVSSQTSMPYGHSFGITPFLNTCNKSLDIDVNMATTLTTASTRNKHAA